jgi:16S rRNA (uracil1498-N3)-methyltransferase
MIRISAISNAVNNAIKSTKVICTDVAETADKEALKQCGGIKKMEFDNITKVEEINYKEYDLIIVPYECEEEKKIFTIFEGIKPKKVLYVIGPEGGFEKEEIDKFVKEGAVVVTLGKRILRAETAAIVTGGILINGFN